MSEREFHGRIGRRYDESEPWWPQETRASEDAPNVLMVVLDDVGFGQLGCYGGLIDTPDIDRLAENGLRYNNFHTTALCSPTRSCLKTDRKAVGEGVFRQLNPGFDFIEAARELIVERGPRRRGARRFVEGRRGDALRSARATLRTPEKLERVLDTLLQGELEIEGLGLQQPLTAIGRVLAYALITASWVVGSAILTDVRPVFGALGWTVAAFMTLLFLVALHNARARE